MNRTLLCLCLALLAVMSAAQVSVDFEAGVNITFPDSGETATPEDIEASGFGFRIMLPNLLLPEVVASTGVFVDEESASVDFSVQTFSPRNGLPVAVSAFYNITALVSIPELLFNVEGAANYIATWPHQLVELDSDENEVIVHDLADFAFETVSDIFESENSLLLVKSARGSLTVEDHSVVVEVSSMTSLEVGILNLVEEALIPRTHTLLCNITGYVKQAPENLIRIVYATAAGNAEVQLDTGIITNGIIDPLTQAFTELSATVIVDGTVTDQGVAVSAAAEASVEIDLSDLLPGIAEQLEQRFDSNWAIYFTNVTYSGETEEGVSHVSHTGTGRRRAQMVQANQEPTDDAPTDVPVEVPTDVPVDVPTGIPTVEPPFGAASAIIPSVGLAAAAIAAMVF